MRCLFSWLKEFVPSLNVSVEDLSMALTMKGLEVEGIEKISDDWVLDISITPNRPDWLSMLGIAREVAAIYGLELLKPEITEKREAKEKDVVPISIDSPELCLRYTASIIKGVKIASSPSWLSSRLNACGIRSINNIVDITNYVLLETGQPLHAFDLHRLKGPEIRVRTARSGEKIITLDGQERELEPSMLVIADSSEPVAVAGVMGGGESEVSAETKDILLESAWFASSQVRRTAKCLKLSTESSYRFERGVDPENVVYALNRATELILELSGGTLIVPLIDVYPKPFEPQSMSLRLERLQKFLGTDISLEQTLNILQSLGFHPYLKDAFTIDVSIPSFRLDITEEIDLIEEVARLYGYENIPTKMPEGVISRYTCPAYLTEKDAFSNKLRQIMKGQGITEIVSYSFISPKDIEAMSFKESDPRRQMVRLQNPISEDQAVMRTSLVPSLLRAISLNQAHKNMDLKLFEIGKIFQESTRGELPFEEQRIASAWTGLRHSDSWNLSKEKADIFDIKGLIEEIFSSLFIRDWKVVIEERSEPFYAPYNCARIVTSENICIGTFGEISQECIDAFDIIGSVFVFDFSLDRLLSISKAIPKYKLLPKYPSIERDVSIILPENIHAQKLLDFIDQHRPSFLESVKIFDVYKGKNIPKGEKSIGIRLIYRSEKHTLSENEIVSIHESFVVDLMEQFNARLRT